MATGLGQALRERGSNVTGRETRGEFRSLGFEDERPDGAVPSGLVYAGVNILAARSFLKVVKVFPRFTRVDSKVVTRVVENSPDSGGRAAHAGAAIGAETPHLGEN